MLVGSLGAYKYNCRAGWPGECGDLGGWYGGGVKVHRWVASGRIWGWVVGWLCAGGVVVLR